MTIQNREPIQEGETFEERASRGSEPIYMDHNATTPVLPEVAAAMWPCLTDLFGNPSSGHFHGRAAAAAVEKARHQIARLIGCSPEEVVFTAGATESDNLALRGAVRVRQGSGRRGGRPHLITCAIEHEAVLETCRELSEEGCAVTVLPVDRHGMVDPGAVEQAITPDTILVSLMMANNEIGTVQPLAEVGSLCRERGVLLHSDAVQAAGRLPIDVNALGVDLMSLTAHKMYGPKGTGALFVRAGVDLRPQLRGGGQERGLRSGTLNVAGIVGFGAAAEAALRDLEAQSRLEAGLRDALWQEIRTGCEGIVPVAMNGHPVHRLPNNLNVAFDGIESEALITALRHVAALSAGSACASGTSKGSYVIRALGLGEARARSSIRFGLGRSNTRSQVDLVARRLAESAARLASLAPDRAATLHNDLITT